MWGKPKSVFGDWICFVSGPHVVESRPSKDNNNITVARGLAHVSDQTAGYKGTMETSAPPTVVGMVNNRH